MCYKLQPIYKSSASVKKNFCPDVYACNVYMLYEFMLLWKPIRFNLDSNLSRFTFPAFRQINKHSHILCSNRYIFMLPFIYVHTSSCIYMYLFLPYDSIFHGVLSIFKRESTSHDNFFLVNVHIVIYNQP